jgi:hypothetical protein
LLEQAARSFNGGMYGTQTIVATCAGAEVRTVHASK